MDFILAHSRYKRHKFPESIKICDELLNKNPQDQSAWMLKCSCLIKENYADELQTQEDGLAEMMVEEDQRNKLARVGTSFKAGSSNHNPIMRPMNSGRIGTGFARVGTSAASRAGSKGAAGMLRTGRIMTKAGVPTTSNGRVLRLATASLQQYGENFFDSSKADLRRISQRKSMARLVFLYLFYVEHNLKKALELSTYCTQIHNYSDPFWKLALAKCFYFLSFLPQAEKQLLSSLQHNYSIEAYLYLSKIHQKRDNVEKSIQALMDGVDKHPGEPKLWLYIGRIWDRVGESQKAINCYKKVLSLENCNVEAVANFAAYYFYKDQPQIALKLYQRLLELGLQSPQLWMNMALCLLSHNQPHLIQTCIDRALLQATDPILLADIWYDIGCVMVELGELESAELAWKAAVSRGGHVEAWSNLGVLQGKKGNIDGAIAYAQKSWRQINNFQAGYNLSIWYFKTNNLQKSDYYNKETLKLYASHAQSLHLSTMLLHKLSTL